MTTEKKQLYATYRGSRVRLIALRNEYFAVEFISSGVVAPVHVSALNEISSVKEPPQRQEVK